MHLSTIRGYIFAYKATGNYVYLKTARRLLDAYLEDTTCVLVMEDVA